MIIILIFVLTIAKKKICVNKKPNYGVIERVEEIVSWGHKVCCV